MGKVKDSESGLEDDSFSEEEKLLRRRGIKNKDDPKNKLKLGEFHRNNIGKKKNRKPSLKKKLRDAQRLLQRQGLPEEIKAHKEQEAKLLKKSLKK